MEPFLVLAVILVSFIAGLIGAFFGLGGGIIVIPALTLALGFSMQEAIGASLMGVIASSSGSAARYVEQGFTNIKLGMLLETATTIGSMLGAIIAVYLDQDILAILFSLVLVYGSYHMLTKRERVIIPSKEKCDDRALDLSCQYIDPKTNDNVCYDVKSIPLGLGASVGAGSLSGMLGVGGGVIKVPVMNLWMCVPMRAATATSNFMIGVTALAGAVVYFQAGLIEPILAGTVAIGVLLGALTGSKVAYRAGGRSLRIGFGLLLLVVAGLMLLKGLDILEVV